MVYRQLSNLLVLACVGILPGCPVYADDPGTLPPAVSDTATVVVDTSQPLADTASPSPSPPPVSPITTNRPTQGTCTGVVGPGVFQIETGAVEQTFKGGVPSLFTLQSQFRFGLGKTTEVAVTSPLFNTQGGNTGIGDNNVQFKWDYATIPRPDGNAVLAVIPNLTIPSGAAAFRNAGAVEQLIFSADIPTGKNTQNLTLNVAPTSLVDPATGSRFTQIFYAAYETIPVNSTVSTWFEISGFGPDASVHGITQTNLDTGLEFLVGGENQVDFDILKGVSERGTDWFFTVGFSHRFR